VDAAILLLANRSYAGTGVDEICRVAAAKKGSFYHFFPSKADLTVVAIQQQWERTREEIFEPLHRSGEIGLGRVRELVERTAAAQKQAFDQTQRFPGCPFGNIGQEMAHQDGRIRAAVEAVFEAHCGYIESWLDEAARARQVMPGDNRLRARQVVALLEGALLSAKVAADPSLFVQICGAWPAIAGRLPSGRPAAGTPPELL
jgi:TetR/AcrR family transcriptional repressor of nem operon